MQRTNTRLDSLDILRGLDIFLLVCFQPVVFHLLKKCGLPCCGFFVEQMSHTDWVGLTAWDMVMPLFMFMAGVSMPFSFRKYAGGKDIYWRIFKRVVVLWIFGMIVQGNLLAFDIQRLRLYSNTLQSIAVGYFFSALILLNFKTRGQLVMCALFFITYWLILTFNGDFTPNGNFAEKVDCAVLGSWRDGVKWENGQWAFAPWYRYTWILSSLNFTVTVMLGVFAGKIVMGDDKLKNVKYLFLGGAALILCAWLLSFQMPIIKKIWSSSMTLMAGGICFVLLGVFYAYIDCFRRGKYLHWLKIYGMNSIFAYVITLKVSFRSIAESVFFSLKEPLGDEYGFFINVCNYAIIFGILLYMYKHKIYLRA